MNLLKFLNIHFFFSFLIKKPSSNFSPTIFVEIFELAYFGYDHRNVL